MKFPLVLLLLCLFSQSEAQEWREVDVDKLNKFTLKWAPSERLVDVYITTLDKRRVNGLLYQVTDSTIKVANPNYVKKGIGTPREVQVTNMGMVVLREDNRKRRYFLWGAAIGLVAGSLAGGLIAPEFPLGLFIPVAGGSMVTSAILASHKIYIPLKGDKAKFNKYQKRLKSLSVSEKK